MQKLRGRNNHFPSAAANLRRRTYCAVSAEEIEGAAGRCESMECSLNWRHPADALR